MNIFCKNTCSRVWCGRIIVGSLDIETHYGRPPGMQSPRSAHSIHSGNRSIKPTDDAAYCHVSEIMVNSNNKGNDELLWSVFMVIGLWSTELFTLQLQQRFLHACADNLEVPKDFCHQQIPTWTLYHERKSRWSSGLIIHLHAWYCHGIAIALATPWQRRRRLYRIGGMANNNAYQLPLPQGTFADGKPRRSNGMVEILTPTIFEMMLFSGTCYISH